MRVTVLGCGAAYPRAGGACSGYLVSSGDTNVWLDAGNGTMSNLQQHISFRDVDAIVLSHSHADHISDVLPFMYAMGYDPTVEIVAQVPLHALRGVVRILSQPIGGTANEMFFKVFDVRPVDEPFEVGPLSFAPFKTVHPPPTYGFRITDGASTLVYTADTAYFDELAGHCADADLLICEATFVEGAKADQGIHLWAKEAGRVAADANAKRVVLTHIWPRFDTEQAVREAATAYSGPIEAAVEGKTYDL